MKKLIFLVCFLTIFSLQAMEEGSCCQKDLLDYSTDPKTCTKANLVVAGSCIGIGVGITYAPVCISMSPIAHSIVLTAGITAVCEGIRRFTYATVIAPEDKPRRVTQFFATLCCFLIPDDNDKNKTEEEIYRSTEPLVMEKN